MAKSGERFLKTNRGIIKCFLLSIITLGIYGLWAGYDIGRSVNIVASKRDGEKTMNFILMLILTVLTAGIASLVWYHRISNRIGAELISRKIPYNFNAGTFWLWSIVGACIGIGPIVYTYKLFKATNMICEHYNNH